MKLPLDATDTPVATYVVVTSVKAIVTVLPGLKLKPETVTGQPCLTLTRESVI